MSVLKDYHTDCLQGIHISLFLKNGRKSSFHSTNGEILSELPYFMEFSGGAHVLRSEW
jgi:hypothetical protein